jgi:LmbE family N-acetylglucosaminyl deacetylase
MDRVLVVAPHADDETLGVGGTIARLAAEGHAVAVAVMTGHGDQAPHPLWPRELWDTIRDEARQAMKVLGVSQLLFREIPAVGVAEQPHWKLNKITSDLLEDVRPTLLFVPFLNDIHSDHRALFQSFSVAWRPCTEVGRGIREIFAYETASETHWATPYVEGGFLPNTWFDISAHLERKIGALSCYKTQIRPAPDARSLEAIRALAVWRGSQVGVAAAEAFVMVRKLVERGTS